MGASSTINGIVQIISSWGILMQEPIFLVPRLANLPIARYLPKYIYGYWRWNLDISFCRDTQNELQ